MKPVNRNAIKEQSLQKLRLLPIDDGTLVQQQNWLVIIEKFPKLLQKSHLIHKMLKEDHHNWLSHTHKGQAIVNIIFFY